MADLKSKKVLVVDDQKSMRGLVRFALIQMGMETVDGAESGEEDGREQDDFLADVAGQHGGGERVGGVGGDGPRQRAAEPEGVRHEVLAGRENHVVAQDEPAAQQRCADGEGEHGRQHGKRAPPARCVHCPSFPLPARLRSLVITRR